MDTVIIDLPGNLAHPQSQLGGLPVTLTARPLVARPRSCQFLPRLANLEVMSTMNISLPNALKEFVEGQVAEQGYGTSSEYVRELIRKDRDRQSLRALVMEGARSAPASPADAAYFDDLRSRIRHADGW